MRAEQLDAVGVTMGPGLEICLRVGYRAARALARDHGKPFVAVNHLEAHVLMTRAVDHGKVHFPFLTLLVSGGHCQLLLARDVADYVVLGGTLDDALGEAFDKTARLLGLEVGGGGGPALEALARDGNPAAIPFPVPMRKRLDCNFSYAGLKTSVRTAIAKLGGESAVVADRRLCADIAASFQETAVRHLEERTRRAMRLCDANATGATTLVVAGGVAANAVVRSRLEQLCRSAGWAISVPPARLCTDNGVMVAWAAIERLGRGIADNYENLDVRARWPLAKMGDMAMPLPEGAATVRTPAV
jgi:N6-L-threonylcarbamoyladenine synthase